MADEGATGGPPRVAPPRSSPSGCVRLRPPARAGRSIVPAGQDGITRPTGRGSGPDVSPGRPRASTTCLCKPRRQPAMSQSHWRWPGLRGLARRSWRGGGVCRAGAGAPLRPVEGQRQAGSTRSHGSTLPDLRLGQEAGIRCGWPTVCSTRCPAGRAPLPRCRYTRAADRGAARDDPTGGLWGRGATRGQHRGAGPAGPWRTRSGRRPRDAVTMPGEADRLAQRAGSGGAAQAVYRANPDVSPGRPRASTICL
jgi:hypothetical protein